MNISSVIHVGNATNAAKPVADMRQGSMLAEFEGIYYLAKGKLCSEDCICSGSKNVNK